MPTAGVLGAQLDLVFKEYPDRVVFQNEYNEECRDKVGSLLRELGHKDALQWLLRETEPIG